MRFLYVTHNGIGTPLVRSQVLPYLRLLADRGHVIDLVTFERGDPYPEGEFPRERWHPLQPRAGGSLLAKLLDIARGAWSVGSLARVTRADALHARSYVPAAICLIAGRVLGLPYIFDMRGFLGEEYLDAGLWTTADVRYRALRLAERHLLRRAASIVVLTHAAKRRLRTDPRYASDVASKDIAVIPCAVDLERFRPPSRREPMPTLVYSGSLGMWYLLDEMLRVYGYAQRATAELRFLFLNKSEHQLIRAAWSQLGLPEDRVEIRAADFADMPAQLGRAHVGIVLLRRVPSKIGSSPIKIGEYLACGLPVVVNEGLGDSDEQVRAAVAGHVVLGFDDESLARAGAAVGALISDEGARVRARKLAETEFDVRMGAAAYDAMYGRIRTVHSTRR